MPTSFTHLREYRKQTPLILADIAQLLGLQDNTPLSKAEKGHRQPSLDMVLTYHLLFQTPLLSYFDTFRTELKNTFVERIPGLIEDLKDKFHNERAMERIECLNAIFTRLKEEK